jgi:hypothetical protein
LGDGDGNNNMTMTKKIVVKGKEAMMVRWWF